MAKKRFNIFAAVAAGFAAFVAVLSSRSARADDVPVADINAAEPTDSLQAPQGSSPLGLRNKNPFNLEFRNIGWVGEIGTDGRFSVFDTQENGIRAGMINIHTKMTRDGFNTVRLLISALSPAFENPTEAFIQFVSRRLGVAPDQPIAWRQNIIVLSKAIIQFENGSQPFSNEELEDALARTGRA